MKKKSKVILLFSGGLDTLVICHWLSQKGYEVVCLAVDVGQGDNFGELQKKAMNAGATEFVRRDIKEEFVTDGLFWCMQAQAKYEGQYIPCTAVARPFIMREAINVAHDLGAESIAHGATGKGNDQVRFEFAKIALDDSLELIVPWRDKEFYTAIPGRKEAIEYAGAQGIPVEASIEKPWSTDANIGHTSHESGELEDPRIPPSDDMFSRIKPPWLAEKDLTVVIRWRDGKPVAVYSPQASGSYDIDVYFRKGFPISINGIARYPIEIISVANAYACANGIGIVDMVEDRFLNNLKSRNVYEAPGMTLLYECYRALQQICLGKEDVHKSLHMGIDYGRLVYEGWWYKDTRKKRSADRRIKNWREKITGNVKLRLFRGGMLVVGRKSPNSLYDERRATMERDEEYDPSGVSLMLKELWENYK